MLLHLTQQHKLLKNTRQILVISKVVHTATQKRKPLIDFFILFIRLSNNLLSIFQNTTTIETSWLKRYRQKGNSFTLSWAFWVQNKHHLLHCNTGGECEEYLF